MNPVGIFPDRSQLLQRCSLRVSSHLVNTIRKIMDLSTLDRTAIVKRLRGVIDPELGVNIVDLGLVYGIYPEEDLVVVEYTVTTPGCPMRRYLQQKVEEALDSMDQIEVFEARVVWEPEWNVDMIKNDVEFFAHPPPRAQV